MKILVGVHCNDKNNSLMAALALRTELHLLAYHIHQPALDAAAVIAKVNAYEATKQPDHNIEPFQQTLNQIEEGIHKLLLAGNQNAFIDNANAWLDKSLTSPLRNMFNGYLIYGINTEQEAQFIRDNNGMMIHIVSTEHSRLIEIQQGELATYCVNNQKPQLNTLNTIAKRVKEHFAMLDKETQEAA